MEISILALWASFACSCSLEIPTRETFKIVLEEKSAAAEALWGLATADPRALSAPATLSEFDCFGVNVTGSGILSNLKSLSACSSANGFAGRGAGLGAENLVRRGQTIELDVPAGTERRIDVYGIYPPPAACAGSEGTNPSGYLLGSAVRDLLEPATVVIPISYASGASPDLNCGAAGGGAGAGFGSAFQFDGASNGLNVTQTGATTSAQYTLEAWVMLTATPSGGAGWGCVIDMYGAPGNVSLCINNTANTVYSRYYTTTCSNTTFTSTTALVVGTKYHLALVLNGATVKLYINGVADATTGSFSAIAGCSVAQSFIGHDFSGAGRLPAIIDEVRVSDVARYASNFTPPSAPFSSDGNTVLLMHFDSGATSGSPDASNPAATFTATGSPASVTSSFP